MDIVSISTDYSRLMSESDLTGYCLFCFCFALFVRAEGAKEPGAEDGCVWDGRCRVDSGHFDLI